MDYKSPNEYTWSGTTIEDDFSVTFIKDGNGIAGSIYNYQQSSLYRIYPIDNEISAIIKTECSSGITDTCGNIPPETPTSLTNCLDCDEEAEDCSSHIDILFLLPPDVQEWINNQKFIDSYLNILVSELNLAFANSNITHTVDFEWVDFEWVWSGPGEDGHDECIYEVKDFQKDPEAKFLRDEYNADIVIMLRSDNPWGSDGPTGCVGLPLGEMGNDESFIIIEIQETLISFIFTHEIGHVLGAAHLFPTGSNVPDPQESCNWAHIVDVENGDRYSTVMIQGTGDILHFSDPEINFMDTPTGKYLTFDENTEKYNAAHMHAPHIRNTGAIVSNYQEAPNVNANASVSIQNCMLNLYANVQPINSEYEFSWYWSYDGIFDNQFPGILLGNGESLVIDEPDDNPCTNYFIQLVVYLNGEEVDSEVINQRGGICSDNVQCEEEQQKIFATTNHPNNQDDLQASINSINFKEINYAADITGKILFENTDNFSENEIHNKILSLYKGVYLLIGRNNNGAIISIKKISL